MCSDSDQLHRVKVSAGVTLAAYDLGGKGPNLLLLHANGFGGKMYLPLVKQLRAHFHVCSFDFRGHALSDLGPGDFWKSYAEDTLTVVQQLGIEGCFVFGHSLGGSTALWTEILRPGTFKGMFVFEPVLCSPALGQRADSVFGALVLANIARKRKSKFADRAAAVKHLKSKLPFSEFHPESLWAYFDAGLQELPDGTVELRCKAATESDLFAHWSHYISRTLFTQLHSIRCPLVVAAGRDSGNSIEYLPRAALEVAAAVSQARHASFEHMDHMGPLTHPADIAQHIGLCFTHLEDVELLPKYLVLPQAKL